VHQIIKAIEIDVPASSRAPELENQVIRLQSLISHLLEKNEELRLRLAAGSGGTSIYFDHDWRVGSTWNFGGASKTFR
jgi:hypothetical protein